MIVASFVAILAAGLSALGWYVNRRVAAWSSVLQRLSAAEAKLDLVDVSGTHGNRTAIEHLRREVDALEAAERRDVAELAGRISSNSLSMAQLSERLNSHVWQNRQPPRANDRGASGDT